MGSRPAGDSQIFFLPYSFERKIIDLLNNLRGFSFFWFKPQVNLEDREKWQFSRAGRYGEVEV